MGGTGHSKLHNSQLTLQLFCTLAQARGKKNKKNPKTAQKKLHRLHIT